LIRRWSCIINLNQNFYFKNKFITRHKINLFKTSVNFKRFTFRMTKFKRKALVRLKHRTNFLLYINVIKLWVKDYLFNKNFSKYQFFNKIFINNFFFYNFNFIKNRNENFFYNFNFYFSVFTNKSYLYFYNKPSFYKNTPLTLAWFNKIPVVNNSIVPVFFKWENYFFPYNNSTPFHYDFNIIFDEIFNIILKKNIEFKKIFILLFYNKILKS
jgi:hypothetical protein